MCMLAGPDWKWDDQDSNGLGATVEGCNDDGWARVKWDGGRTNNYRVSYDDCYDLRRA